MSVARYVRARGASLDPARVKRLSVEGGWIVLGQVASVLGALLLVRVLTEYLNPSQYGELALGLTIAGLVNQVVMGGLSSGIGRFYSIAAEESDLSGYLRASWRLMGYATLAVGILAIALVAGLLWTGRSEWLPLLAAMLVFSVLSGFNACLSGVQNAARQRAVVALHSGMHAWLKMGLAVAMIVWLGASSAAAVAGYALAALLVTLSQLGFLRRLIRMRSKGEPKPSEASWTSQIWAYSWPFSVWGIFTWAQQASDRWALETFSTTQEVGQYAVVFQLGYTPIALVSGLAISFLGPILYQRSGAATDHARTASVHRLAWQMTGLSLAVTGCAFVLTAFLHEPLFQILVAAPFRESSRFLPWVVLAGGIFAAGQMLALKLMSEMKASAMTGAKIGTALLGIGLSVLGARYLGVAGVVAALLAFSIAYFAWMVQLARRRPSNLVSANAN